MRVEFQEQRRAVLWPSSFFAVHLSVLIASLFFLLLSMPVSAPAADEPAVLGRYDKMVDLAEEFRIFEEDVMNLIPRIKEVDGALLARDYDRAENLLEEIEMALEVLRRERENEMNRSFRLEWLEIYREIVQKYAVLALLAYFLVKLPYFRRKLAGDRMNVMARIYLAMLVAWGAIFFSFIDLSRYGDSAWAFLDIQLVLVAAGGLLGGLWCGLLAGGIVGFFRLVLKPDVLHYFALALAAGVLGGLMTYLRRFLKHTWSLSLACGLVIGLLHGTVVYLPMTSYLPVSYAAMSAVFLALLEAVGLAIMMAVIATVLREEQRRVVERELLKTKMLFLQAQISPHFLYNALNTISAVCSREGAHEAHRLVLHLAGFLRRAARRMDDNVDLKEELAYIDSYLEIEKARFQDRLKVEKDIRISPRLFATRIPFLILQPLVENAIKHGISRKQNGGTVKLSLYEKEGCLCFTVEDDGPGVRPERIESVLRGESEEEEAGVGIRNINQRLTRLYGSGYGLVFGQSNGKGTAVTVRFPLNGDLAGGIR